MGRGSDKLSIPCPRIRTSARPAVKRAKNKANLERKSCLCAGGRIIKLDACAAFSCNSADIKVSVSDHVVVCQVTKLTEDILVVQYDIKYKD